MKLSVIVVAHNEEKLIGNCLKALLSMRIPKGIEPEYLVVLDRCTDRTKEIVEGMGIPILEKNFRWNYSSPLVEAADYGITKTDGELILLCDADIQEIPTDALVRLLLHLTNKVKRVSADVRTKATKIRVNFFMWLKEKNAMINPLGTEPRGAFQLFRRETYEVVGGCDPTKPSFDTVFDMKIKARGWKVKRAPDVLVIERRDYTLDYLTRQQINAGRARRQLGIGFPRTFLHSIFRGRVFVLYGYLAESLNEMFKRGR